MRDPIYELKELMFDEVTTSRMFKLQRWIEEWVLKAETRLARDSEAVAAAQLDLLVFQREAARRELGNVVMQACATEKTRRIDARVEVTNFSCLALRSVPLE